MVTTERKQIEPKRRRKWAPEEVPPGKRWLIGVAARTRNSIEVLADALGNKIDGGPVIELEYARDEMQFLRQDSKNVFQLVEGLKSIKKRYRKDLTAVGSKPIEMTRGIDIKLKRGTRS